jgi:sulfonate transport system permease protein
VTALDTGSTTLTTPTVASKRSVPPRARIGLRIAGPLLILALWWGLSATGTLTPDVLASPVSVLHTFAELWSNGQLGDALTVSLQRAGAGLILGVTAGLVLGVLATVYWIGNDTLDSAMQTLRALPFLSLVPLFMVWFGIGEPARIILIAVATTFPMYVSTVGALRNSDQNLLECARLFGMGRLDTVRQIVIPEALPALFSGLRLSTTLSVIALIAAEEINTTSGLGYLMSQAQSYSRTDILTAVILIYGVLGITADAVIRTLERVSMPWLTARTSR